MFGTCPDAQGAAHVNLPGPTTGETRLARRPAPASTWATPRKRPAGLGGGATPTPRLVAAAAFVTRGGKKRIACNWPGGPGDHPLDSAPPRGRHPDANIEGSSGFLAMTAHVYNWGSSTPSVRRPDVTSSGASATSRGQSWPARGSSPLRA